MAEKGGVQSVERIFQLIEQLAAHPTGVSLQKLAGETGLAKSTVHRLLASLVGLGYVAQHYGWNHAYIAMIAMALVGMAVFLLMWGAGRDGYETDAE